ncbi:hypothetical protein Dalk_2735 [Desulfatibacillum aliphaticivorans]|uniref:FeoB-associated Cys-rich membrane protein n=1 Tax=Desulfatibacillum aliphaticivorans TaxID=218208 RepID=B8FKQ5_DESAL|nr:FeoB-associated Cys-rich membrane protein [Desulfatibacillum aliphaticivorans]ACL04427.1 hypothetical protein Dalk_2735 [Desulfatibacillum aliphaticivorans]
MDVIIVGIIALAAVWYLFKQFSAAFKNKEPGCCCGCDSCPANLPGRGEHEKCDALCLEDDSQKGE